MKKPPKNKTDPLKYPGVNYNPVYYDSSCRISATWSHPARRKWASRQILALNALHEFVSPTHWATIKLNEPLTLGEIRTFNATVAKAIEYQNRHKGDRVDVSHELEITTNGRHIAIYAVPEIDEAWCIHYHVLIRASNIDPNDFLNGVINKYNRKHGKKVTMEWIKSPNTTLGVSVYSLKPSGRKKSKKGDSDCFMLLFSPGSLSRYIFQAGRYFLKFRLKKLRQESRKEWRFRVIESQTESIVDEW